MPQRPALNRGLQSPAQTGLAQGLRCRLWPGSPTPTPGGNPSGALTALCAGPRGVAFPARYLPPLHPNQDSQTWGPGPPLLRACCSPLGPRGWGLAGRGGSRPSLAQRSTCPPPKAA